MKNKKKKLKRIIALLAVVSMIMVNITPVRTLADDTFTLGDSPDWEKIAFGANTGDASKHTLSVASDSQSAVLTSTDGKITGAKEEGINFLYKSIKKSDNFKLSATANIASINTSNYTSQSAFGLMIRDSIGSMNDNVKVYDESIAVGVLEQETKAWKRVGTEAGGTSEKQSIISSTVEVGNTYDLLIEKIGGKYLLSINGSVAATYYDNDFFDQDNLYVGLFTSRSFSIKYSNIKFQKITQIPTSINITKNPEKLSYYQNDGTAKIDWSGAQLEALINGEKITINNNDLIIVGFDTTKSGNGEIKIDYCGIQTSIPINIIDLCVEKLSLQYPPAKTDYTKGDVLNLKGISLEAVLNSGEVIDITDNDYSNEAQNGKFTVTEFDTSNSVNAGTANINYMYNDKVTSISFSYNVSANDFTGLEIVKEPSNKTYFTDIDYNEVDTKGMMVYAVYGTDKVLLTSSDYTIGDVDLKTAGSKKVNITLDKGANGVHSDSFNIVVKNKELTGIGIKQYPDKSTFEIGEEFTSDNMIIEAVYDSKNNEVLTNETDYMIDSSKYNKDIEGQYTINIVAKNLKTNNTLCSTSYIVTVREKTDYSNEKEWNSTYFGQSTKAEGNTIDVESDESGKINSIKLMADDREDKTDRTAASKAGKITSSHDGITFYYTELDGKDDNFVYTADFTIETYGTASAFYSQEAFGIMARDTLGVMGTDVTSASNETFTGFLSGAGQLYHRCGITNNSASGDDVVTEKLMIGTAFTNTSSKQSMDGMRVRLVLEKNNTGYKSTIYTLDNDGIATLLGENSCYSDQSDGVYEYTKQDEKMYVGFFAARYATVKVDSYSLDVTSAVSDAPRTYAKKEAINPTVTVSSLSTCAQTDYKLEYTTNVDGLVTIKSNNIIINKNISVTANKNNEQLIKLAKGDNKIQVIFTPDSSQNISSNENVILNFGVSMKQYNVSTNIIYVSPKGVSSGTGSKTQPLDLTTAVTYCGAGQKIYMLGGTYNLTEIFEIPKGNNGTAKAMKYLMANPKEKVKINCNGELFCIYGNYWTIKDMEIYNGAGIRVGGCNNWVENIVTHNNTNTGIQISCISLNVKWPANNTIINCESYDNRDVSDNDADGFAAKLTSGEGNRFIGCIAHNNIDDGWDLYTKLETGAIGAVLIQDCIAYNNGTLTDGTVGGGDKNGFKLGGEGIAVNHILKNCISFGNGKNGYDSNSNPSGTLYCCKAYNNTGSNICMIGKNKAETYNLIGITSIKSGNCTKIADVLTTTNKTKLTAASNYFYNGTTSVNMYNTRFDYVYNINTKDFAYYMLNEGNVNRKTYTRKAGKTGTSSIVTGDFLKVTDKSYKLVFNANGGNCTTKNKNIMYSNKYGTLPTPTRAGYTFAGWYTDKSKGSKVTSDTKLTVAKNITVYARWNKVSVSKAAISSLKGQSKKFIVANKKVSGAAGYQVTYSLASNFKSSKTVTYTSTSKTVTGLKAGKTYYVKVRAYKLDSAKKKVYGSYSTVKKIKTKW